MVEGVLGFAVLCWIVHRVAKRAKREGAEEFAARLERARPKLTSATCPGCGAKGYLVPGERCDYCKALDLRAAGLKPEWKFLPEGYVVGGCDLCVRYASARALAEDDFEVPIAKYAGPQPIDDGPVQWLCDEHKAELANPPME